MIACTARDSIELYLHYNAKLPDAALCFRGGTDPAQLKLAPLQDCIWCRPSKSEAHGRNDRMRELFDSAPFLRFFALGLLYGA